MNSVLTTALSGLAAQAKRLEVSASNVVNLRSTGVQPGAAPQAGEFVPQRVELTSVAGGGVRANAVPVDPPSFQAYEPGAPDADADGFVARPNVDLVTELVTQLDAKRSYQANLKIIETQSEILGDLLDVVS